MTTEPSADTSQHTCEGRSSGSFRGMYPLIPPTLKQGFLLGARESLALMLGVAIAGAAFGVLANQSGMELWEATAMSAIVFAGASQFIALDFWGQDIPILAVILTTFVVNLRHLLMGAAIADLYKKQPLLHNLLSWFVLIDESWALTCGAMRKGMNNAAYLTGAGLTIYVGWVGATIFGASVLNTVGNPAAYGLDFTLYAAFICLVASLYSGKEDILPWIVAAIVAVLGERYLPGKWYIIAAGFSGGLANALLHLGTSGKKETADSAKEAENVA